MDPARDVKSTRQLYLGAGFHEGLSLERVGSSAETLEPQVSTNGRRSIRIRGFSCSGRGPTGSRPFLLPYAPMLVEEIYFRTLYPLTSFRAEPRAPPWLPQTWSGLGDGRRGCEEDSRRPWSTL